MLNPVEGTRLFAPEQLWVRKAPPTTSSHLQVRRGFEGHELGQELKEEDQGFLAAPMVTTSIPKGCLKGGENEGATNLPPLSTHFYLGVIRKISQSET